MEKSIEIFTLVAGVIYVILEIRQKPLMWVLGIFTSLASMWLFFLQGLYASSALNTYYLLTAFIGLWQWGKDRKRLADVSRETEQDGDVLHLNRLTVKALVSSAIVTVVAVAGLGRVMALFGNPMSYVDSAVAVLSAIATWWLVRSYLEQWWLWVLANALSVWLCASQQMWWLTMLYAAYTLSAVYGWIYWRRHGRYVEQKDITDDTDS
ncbi:MAG: nicotinamide mononucleotide transporter [Bacteroidales bacterium]|nr:nicotinamide mononucleotide transporter [Bacteroidales bacterium]